MNLEFKNLGLSDKVVKSIELLGFKTPSKIQEQMIPLILKGEDLIGQAQTGTGKTLAYTSSILSKIKVDTNVVRAIILTPTRELALQVCADFESINKSKDFDVLAVFGGSSIEEQIRRLNRGVDIVVGTPGRVLDLLKRKKLNINDLEFFVLDEADEMLDMGFLEDMKLIFQATNEKKQVLMLSATMPKEVEKLAKQYMKKDYKHILIESTSKTADNINQTYYAVNEKTRLEVLCRILDLKNAMRTIVFCQTKRECDELLSSLSLKGYNAEAMHGDIAQNARIQTLDRFKLGSFKILIATDVAARGIHIDDIECVVNYRLPQDYESYIHRIGRTGRAGNDGEAVSLVAKKDMNFISGIEKFANCKIKKSEVPSNDEIIKLRYEIIKNKAFSMIDGHEADSTIEYVKTLEEKDLISLSAALLKMLVDKEIGSNFDKSVEIDSYNSSPNKNTTRVFLTIGKKDAVKKGSLLDFIKDETNIRKENFNNIEVLSTFTFIDVEDKVVNDFMKKIKNKKFNNRIIRVEKAKRQK